MVGGTTACRISVSIHSPLDIEGPSYIMVGGARLASIGAVCREFALSRPAAERMLESLGVPLLSHEGRHYVLLFALECSIYRVAMPEWFRAPETWEGLAEMVKSVGYLYGQLQRQGIKTRLAAIASSLYRQYRNREGRAIRKLEKLQVKHS